MIDSLLDALGMAGGALDKLGPRPLRGVLAGKPREAMSIIPFSDTLGITNQGDVASGRDVTNNLGITSAQDQGFGSKAIGVGAEALLDPIGLAGGVAGAGKLARSVFGEIPDVLTRRASSALSAIPSRVDIPAGHGHMTLEPFPGAGNALNQAADRMGPRYGDSPLSRDIIDAASGMRGTELQTKLRSNPFLDRIQREIPPGSEILDSGGQALVLRAPGTETAPEGWAIRLSPSLDTLGLPSPERFMQQANGMGPIGGRPNIPEMLSPFRTNDFSERGGLLNHGVRVEHMPLVDPVNKVHRDLIHRLAQVIPGAGGGVEGIVDQLKQLKTIDTAMKDHIHQRILDSSAYGGRMAPFDVKLANMSFMPGQPGRMNVMDGGAIGLTGGSVMPSWSPPISDPNQAIDLIRQGAPRAVRNSLETSAGQIREVQGIPFPSQLPMLGGTTMSDPWRHRQELLAQIEEFIRQAPRGYPASANPALAGSDPISSLLAALVGGSSGLP